MENKNACHKSKASMHLLLLLGQRDPWAESDPRQQEMVTAGQGKGKDGKAEQFCEAQKEK